MDILLICLLFSIFIPAGVIAYYAGTKYDNRATKYSFIALVVIIVIIFIVGFIIKYTP